MHEYETVLSLFFSLMNDFSKIKSKQSFTNIFTCLCKIQFTKLDLLLTTPSYLLFQNNLLS